MWSSITGIQLDVSTNQQGLQLYTCNGQNGTIPVKQSQQDRNSGDSNAAAYVEKYGCLVIETQAWIDGISKFAFPLILNINLTKDADHPEWGVTDFEIFSPTTGPAINYATYDFSTF